MAASVAVQTACPAPLPPRPTLTPPYVKLSDSSNAVHLAPKEVYGSPKSSHVLKWSNGGAGPTGVLAALAEKLLETLPDTRVEWYMNISRITLDLAARGVVDCALTYERDQEAAYIARSDLVRLGCILHDHFVVVGPASSPIAGGYALEVDSFTAIASSNATFLSRDDGSATNCKELEIWSTAGVDITTWRKGGFGEAARSAGIKMRYERRQIFPENALLLANELNAFTLIDYATWQKVRSYNGAPQLQLYSYGGERLLNPCHILVRPDRRTSPAIKALEAFLHSADLTETITLFRPRGLQLFTPPGEDDFAEWKARGRGM